MNAGNHRYVRQMRAAGMKLDALCRHYGIDRDELDMILVQKETPPRRKRHPALDLLEEGHSLAIIGKLFDVSDLQQVIAQSGANYP